MLFVLILSLCVIYVDFHRTKSNMGKVTANGLGAIPYVLAGKATQPSQYRVLVPWLTNLMCGRIFKQENYMVATYLPAYALLRALAIGLSMSLCHALWGNPMYVAVLAIFYMVVAIYDYTDVYFEIAFLALSMLLFKYDYSFLIVPICILAGLNRETATVIPFLAIPSGNWTNVLLALLGVAIGLAIPRLMYGKARRYCGISQYRMNWHDLKSLISEYPMVFNETFHFVLLAGLMVVATVLSPSYYMAIAWVLFVLLAIPARWREVRVFAPCVFLMIPSLLR